MTHSSAKNYTGHIGQKKINPWKLSLLSSAIFSVLGLSACGGGGSGGGSAPAPAPAPPPDNPPTVSVDERIIVSAGDSVSITATASDADGDAITYSWMQMTGDAVSNTDGFDAATASFSAPDDVGTYRFEVSATANGASDTASILVMVLEDVDTAVFIDAEFTGTSDGSIDAPFTELASVLQQSLDDNQDTDFYIKTPSDDTVFELWENDSANINQNISFYGGYLADWQRDEVNSRTPVITDNPRGMRYFNTSEYVEVSGLDLLLDLQNINVNDNLIAISGNNLVTLMVRNNTIQIADHPFDNSSGTLYGVFADTVSSFSLIGNNITTGAAPTSARDSTNNNTGDGDIGNNGSNADDDDGGNGAGGSASTRGGGNGGNGGNGSSEAGNAGASGGPGGNGGSAGGAGNNGTDGQDGNNGLEGNVGTGGSGFGRFTSGGRFAVSSGSSGGKGANGAGGGGGGGGGSSFLGFNGGGGGGGGEGGEGGNGGFGAQSGGASIAVYVVGGTLNDIKDNIITSGNGGIGGIGGLGAQGGAGGSGGSGENGNSNNSGNGGDGGAGGTGGDGGIGASGGGGPSFGIVLNPDTFATISNNQITTGDGGNGGSAIIAREQAAGKGGWSIGIYDADPNDASTPTLDGNTFTLGQAGADGNPSSGTGTAADTNF
jgi:hypothetical protein